MNNPVNDLLDWFSKQEFDAQLDIAFIMSGLHPCFDFYNMPHEYDELIKSFIATIQKYSGTEMENVGFIISFRALFDYVFVRKRGTKEGWEQPKKIFESVLEDSTASEGMKETAKKSLAELPDKMEKWFKICEEWNELKSRSLNDDTIESWENYNMSSH